VLRAASLAFEKQKASARHLRDGTAPVSERMVCVLSKLRIYLETTVFNYYFDKEREGHAEAVRMFEAIGRGEYEGYTSRYVTYELERAPEPKRSDMLALTDKYGINILKTDDEVIRLANIYVREGVIPAKKLLDSSHIASATVGRLDCVLSFNFDHINKATTKEKTAVINEREGYRSVFICTPEEVFKYGKT